MASVVRRNRSLPSNASTSKDASRRRPANDHDGDNRPAKRSRPSGGDGTSAESSRISASNKTGSADQRTTSAAALLRGPNPQVARNRLGGQEPAAPSNIQSNSRQPPPPPQQPARQKSGQAKVSRTIKARKSTDKDNAGTRSAAPQQQQRQRQQRQQESFSPDEHPASPSSRRRIDDDDEEEEDDDDQEDEEADSGESDAEEESYPPSPGKPYAHVAPFTRRVRQSTIQSEWTPLGRGSIKALTSMLQLAQRPILQRLGSSQARRAATEGGLRLITRRILEKVAGSSGAATSSSSARQSRPGLPFPPASLPTRTRRGRPRGGRAEQDGGRETELNFESVLDAKQTLERQLDPVLHAVDLLGDETRRMEDELDRDYETLRLLEAEARARARENRGLLKRAHELAPEVVTAREGSGGGLEEESDVRFRRAEAAGVNPFQDVDDAQVGSLVAQLGTHVGAIRDNMARAAGVGDEVARARASLQAVLAKRLSPARYERAVLGEMG